MIVHKFSEFYILRRSVLSSRHIHSQKCSFPCTSYTIHSCKYHALYARNREVRGRAAQMHVSEITNMLCIDSDLLRLKATLP